MSSKAKILALLFCMTAVPFLGIGILVHEVSKMAVGDPSLSHMMDVLQLYHIGISILILLCGAVCWKFIRHMIDPFLHLPPEIVEKGITADVDLPDTDDLPTLVRRLQQSRLRLQKVQHELETRVEQSTSELEDALRRLQDEANETKKFHLAVESSSDAVDIATVHNEIVYVNPAWQEQTGYTEKEVIGKRTNILRSKLTEMSVVEQMREAKKKSKPFHCDEMVYKRKNGSEYDIELFVYPILEGGSKFYVRIHRDISKRKRADRAKTDFVSLASHQLRTPLTALRWTFGMFNKGKAGELSDFQQELLADAEKCTKNMSQTIGTMLTLSRIEAEDMTVNPSELNVHDLLSSIKDDYRVLYEDKKQTCEIDMPDDLVLETDQRLLQEALANLISNAIKYTPEAGKVTLLGSKDEQFVYIEVCDTGYGIPAHQHKRVFTRFFRADNIVGKSTDGTGLGLYLVFAIVQLLSGKITFTSAENQGTNFLIKLPISPTLDVKTDSDS